MLRIVIEKECMEEIKQAVDIVINFSFEEKNEDACIFDENGEVQLLILNGEIIYMTTHLELILLGLTKPQ